MNQTQRIEWSLLALRVTVFGVMLVWTIDKFLRPEHGAAVFENFYFLAGISHGLIQALGAAELALLVAFVIGWKQRLSYGLVLALHSISTFSSFKQYLAPFESANILFFAAWPMWAACLALYLLRDADRLWALPPK